MVCVVSLSIASSSASLYTPATAKVDSHSTRRKTRASTKRVKSRCGMHEQREDLDRKAQCNRQQGLGGQLTPNERAIYSSNMQTSRVSPKYPSVKARRPTQTDHHLNKVVTQVFTSHRGRDRAYPPVTCSSTLSCSVSLSASRCIARFSRCSTYPLRSRNSLPWENGQVGSQRMLITFRLMFASRMCMHANEQPKCCKRRDRRGFAQATHVGFYENAARSICGFTTQSHARRIL